MLLKNASQYLLFQKIYAKVTLPYISFTYTHMKKHIEQSRQYLEKRGHMVAFLMMALMTTAWINTFQEEVSAAVISTYF